MIRLAGALALLAVQVAVAPAEPVGGGPPAAPVTSTLLGVREQSNVQLTTVGRRSGKPHTVTVWFAVDGDRIYLSTLDPGRDWVRNAKKTPEVRLDFGDVEVTGQLRTVTEPALDAAIRQALRDKYWVAWAAGLVGKGPAETYVIDAVRPATSSPTPD